MKLIRSPKEKKMKTVQYYNLELVVPENTKYISVDEDGQIILWMDIDKPYITEFCTDTFGWCGETIEYDVGTVDLEGIDWKDTLVEY